MPGKAYNWSILRQMTIRFWLLFFLLVPVVSSGQIVDDFSDGNFISMPAWSGMDSHFVVNTSQELQLLASIPHNPGLYGRTSYEIIGFDRPILETQWITIDFAHHSFEHSRKAQRIAGIIRTPWESIRTYLGTVWNPYELRMTPYDHANNIVGTCMNISGTHRSYDTSVGHHKDIIGNHEQVVENSREHIYGKHRSS